MHTLYIVYSYFLWYPCHTKILIISYYCMDLQIIQPSFHFFQIFSFAKKLSPQHLYKSSSCKFDDDIIIIIIIIIISKQAKLVNSFHVSFTLSPTLVVKGLLHINLGVVISLNGLVLAKTGYLIEIID
jgi:hypothetical protein